MTFVTETRLFCKTFVNEYSHDGSRVPGAPRIAEGILHQPAAQIALCISLSQAPRPSLQPPYSFGFQRNRNRLRDGRTAQWPKCVPKDGHRPFARADRARQRAIPA